MANKYTFPNASNGMDNLLVSMQTSFNIFIPMLLLFVYLIVLFGGSISQKRRLGYSDIPMWNLMASISTLMVSIPMTLVVGIIDPLILGVVTTLVIISGLWFFLSKDRGEI